MKTGQGIWTKAKRILGEELRPGEIISRRTFIKTLCHYSVWVGAFLIYSIFPKKMMPKAFAVISGKKVKLGVLCPSHCGLPFVYAHVRGIYKKYGLESEIVYLPGMLEIAKGVISGELQAGQIIASILLGIHVGAGPFNRMKAPMVTTQVTGTNGGVLTIATGRGIKSFYDLKGKTIGVHSPFMTHYVLVKMLLEKWGLDPQKDVQIKIIDFRKLIPAMKNGEIDAFIHPEPLSAVAIQKSIASDFILTKNLWYKHPCCLLSMTKEFFEKETETARLITLATTEAGLLANNYKTRDSVIDLVHEQSKPFGKIERMIYKRAFIPGRSDFDPFPFQSSAQVLLDVMQKQGILNRDIASFQIARETFLSDFSRQILIELKAPQIPSDNNRVEILMNERMY